MAFHGLTSALLAGAAAIVGPAHGMAVHLFHADHVLGTSLDVTIVSPSEQMAELAMRAIRAEITRLDVILSGWRDDSELAALNASARHLASPDLFAVIAAGEAWRQASGGAFSLAAASGGGALLLEETTRTVQAGKPLVLDAIAKGYVIDRAMAAASAVPGIQGLMIDIGGDLCCRGLSPDGKAWRVGIADPSNLADNAAPLTLLALNNGAVASSSMALRGHAIIDPATGAARGDIAMATAVAPTAMAADALATIFHVLPPDQAIALADSLPGVAAHIVNCDGTVQMSKGWEKLAQATPRAAASAWPQGFALKIDYEIPFINGGRRVRVPYVTIWVSDENGAPVRTLAFYADKARFMHENYVFWERIGAGNPGLVAAVTRPTRPPGAYSLNWDGRDDAGRPVPQGRYVVNIEAAREHGGHNIQRLEIELGNAPASATAPAQGEAGPAKVTYGR